MENYNWLIKRHVSALFGHHQAYKEMVVMKINSLAIPTGSHGLHCCYVFLNNYLV